MCVIITTTSFYTIPCALNNNDQNNQAPKEEKKSSPDIESLESFRSGGGDVIREKLPALLPLTGAAATGFLLRDMPEGNDDDDIAGAVAGLDSPFIIPLKLLLLLPDEGAAGGLLGVVVGL